MFTQCLRNVYATFTRKVFHQPMSVNVRKRRLRNVYATFTQGATCDFKYSDCGGIFDSRIALARHRRFPGSQGTTRADPHSTQSLSFTGRAGMATSTGILRQHPGTLGALSDCCPSCDLRALLLLLLPFST